MALRNWSILGIALLMFIMVVNFSNAYTVVNNCTTINASGIYALESDFNMTSFSGSTTYCFSIETDNVEFTCNGHTIYYTDLASTSGAIFLVSDPDGWADNIYIHDCKFVFDDQDGVKSTGRLLKVNQGSNLITVENIQYQGDRDGNLILFSNAASSYWSKFVLRNVFFNITNESGGSSGEMIRNQNWNGAFKDLLIENVTVYVYNGSGGGGFSYIFAFGNSTIRNFKCYYAGEINVQDCQIKIGGYGYQPYSYIKIEDIYIENMTSNPKSSFVGIRIIDMPAKSTVQVDIKDAYIVGSGCLNFEDTRADENSFHRVRNVTCIRNLIPLYAISVNCNAYGVDVEDIKVGSWGNFYNTFAYINKNCINARFSNVSFLDYPMFSKPFDYWFYFPQKYSTTGNQFQCYNLTIENINNSDETRAWDYLPFIITTMTPSYSSAPYYARCIKMKNVDLAYNINGAPGEANLLSGQAFLDIEIINSKFRNLRSISHTTRLSGLKIVNSTISLASSGTTYGIYSIQYLDNISVENSNLSNVPLISDSTGYYNKLENVTFLNTSFEGVKVWLNFSNNNITIQDSTLNNFEAHHVSSGLNNDFVVYDTSINNAVLDQNITLLITNSMNVVVKDKDGYGAGKVNVTIEDNQNNVYKYLTEPKTGQIGTIYVNKVFYNYTNVTYFDPYNITINVTQVNYTDYQEVNLSPHLVVEFTLPFSVAPPTIEFVSPKSTWIYFPIVWVKLNYSPSDAKVRLWINGKQYNYTGPLFYNVYERGNVTLYAEAENVFGDVDNDTRNVFVSDLNYDLNVFLITLMINVFIVLGFLFVRREAWEVGVRRIIYGIFITISALTVVWVNSLLPSFEQNNGLWYLSYVAVFSIVMTVFLSLWLLLKYFLKFLERWIKRFK